MPSVRCFFLGLGHSVEVLIKAMSSCISACDLRFRVFPGAGTISFSASISSRFHEGVRCLEMPVRSSPTSKFLAGFFITVGQHVFVLGLTNSGFLVTTDFFFACFVVFGVSGGMIDSSMEADCLLASESFPCGDSLVASESASLLLLGVSTVLMV